MKSVVEVISCTYLTRNVLIDYKFLHSIFPSSLSSPFGEGDNVRKLFKQSILRREKLTSPRNRVPEYRFPARTSITERYYTHPHRGQHADTPQNANTPPFDRPATPPAMSL